MHQRLYNKPHLGDGACTLALVGTFAPYAQGIAYEGRLNVSGPQGNVVITDWSGDLPHDAALEYDAASQQIVLTWPDYSPGTSIDLPNLNFADGDTGWDKGPGFTIMQGVTAPDPNDPGNNWQAQYANNGGSSAIMSSRSLPAVPGKTYTASVDVQQGGSSANHAGAAVRLLFFDATGAHCGGNDGNVIKSGSNSEWATSSLSMQAPAAAATVKLGASAYRSHENRPLWVDNFKWNGAWVDPSTAMGAPDTRTYSITISVRDDNGCRATWTGTIKGVVLPNIIGYWPCDDVAGSSTLHEVSGHGVAGVVVANPNVSLGAPPLRAGSAGSLRTAALLNQAATIDVSASLLNPKQLTIECLACLDSKGGSTGFVAALNPVTFNEGRPALSSFGSVWTASNTSGAGINSTVPWNAPAHLLLTRDNDHGAFYVNGVLVANASNPTDVTLSDGLLRLLGPGSSPDSYGVVGRISDVRLWDGPVDDDLAAYLASQYLPPLTLSANLPTGRINKPYSGSVVATGGFAGYTYTVDPALPDGVSLNPHTGAVTGTTPDVSTSTYAFTATDARGFSTSISVTLFFADPNFVSMVDTYAPVAHWRMDDAAGATKLVDRIAAEQATLSGAYTLGAAGLLYGDTDTAVQFAGGNAATAAGAKWALGSGDYSILFLAKWTATKFSTPLAVRDGTPSNIMATFSANRSTGSIEVSAQDGTGTIASAVDKAYNDGAPHVIGMTMAAATKTMKLYVDGVLKSTKTLTAARPTTSTMNLTMAGNIGGIQSFAGTLDEIVLFNTLLGDADMAPLASIALTSE